MSTWFSPPVNLEPDLPRSVPTDRPFTRDEATRSGVSPHALRRLLAGGHVRRMLAGVYVATSLGDSTALRCAALRLVVPEDCVVCDRHAGWLLGAEMALAPGEHLELRPISVFRPAGMGRLRNGLTDSGERNLRPGDVTEVDGLQVTTPLRTAWDLGRVRWTEPAISGMDALASLGRFSREELLAGVERFRGMRWVTTLRAVAPLVDSGSQSPGESVSRLRWHEAHLPWPVTQIPVERPSGIMAYLDLGLPELKYAGEYDGVEWHTSTEQQSWDRERRAEVADDGWLLDILVAANIWGPRQDATARFRRGVAEARQRRGNRVVISLSPTP